MSKKGEVVEGTEEDQLEYLDSEHEGKGVVYIDKKGCLRCTQLVGELGKKDYGCGSDTGNTNCPAARMQIMEGLDVESLVDDYIEAIRNLDLEGAAAILSSVKERPEPIVSDFSKELCDRMGTEIVDEEADEEVEEEDEASDEEADEDSDEEDADADEDVDEDE